MGSDTKDKGPRVFVSYSHEDKEWVREWLLPRLEGAGLKVHIDFRDFEIGLPLIVNIERAVEQCDKTILVLSPAWVESNATNFEAAMLQTRDLLNMQKKIIPLMLRDCELPRRLEILTWADFREESNWDTEFARVVGQIKKDIEGVVVEKVEWPVLDEANVEISRLPKIPYELFGRQKEMGILDTAWEAGDRNVLSFVAWGGVGKSALVNKWLEKMRWDSYRGAKKVFGWSFYSQGIKERVTSADRFIEEGLKWFEDANPEEGSMWEKGRRLVDLIRKDRTLLILDGLEPLQWGTTIEQGKIKDPVLSLVVTELAKENGGLCVITTREEVAELGRFAKGVEQRNLEQISKEAGGALLRIGGVKGTDAEREAASEEFGNHALAVNLLATYLHDIEGHNVKDAEGIGDLDIPEEEGRHPRRVIEAFEERFGEGPKVQVLRILGLFDRPAEMGAIEAVRGGEAIEGLTDELAGLTEGQLRDVLDELRGYKLIAKKSEHNPNIVDCHPLVREHFGEKLRLGNADGWREAHGRLYEYYKGVPKKELPDTLAEMEPLFAAVGHGCQAEIHTRVWEEVYWKRVKRGKEHYSTAKLGAFGADLAAVSCFFEKAWSRPVSELKENVQTVVLSGAGFGLRALGRLREAREPMEASLRGLVDQKNWGQAGAQAGILSELYLTLGEVEAAVDYGRQGLEYGNKSNDQFRKMTERARLGNGLHQAGAISEARGLFEEAEGMQKERQAGYPLLYSFQGFLYCDLILSGGGYEEVEERAMQTLEWVTEEHWLLDMGLDKLSLGSAYLLEAVSDDGGGGRDEERRVEIMAKAGDWLGQAVDGLREAGVQEFITRGLLGKAEYYRYIGEYEEAWVDLGEAREIAERGEMNLFLADYHLEAARVCLAEGECEGRSEEGKRDKGKGKKTSGSLPPRTDKGQATACRDSGKGRSGDWKNKARGHWEEAKERVEKMGYHRRDPEVLLIEAEVLGLEGKKEEGKKRLEKAKARIDEMGCHRWDSEVERISEINQKSK